MWFEFIKTEIPEVILIETKVYGDERGFFMETYRQDEFVAHGITNVFTQDNFSKSKKWVLRGFHFQKKNTQAKLVRVSHGAVLDFAIDIRKRSPTYGKYIIEYLSTENKRQLFVPQWFAHGFLTLEEGTEFIYKCDNLYDPMSEGGINYLDTELNIDWEQIQKKYDIQELIINEKDRILPSLKDFYKDNPF